MSDSLTPIFGSQNPSGQPVTVASAGNEAPPSGDAPPTAATVNDGSTTQSKQDRHAEQKIQDLAESRISLARMAIESNPDYIVKMYEEDKDLAKKMFREYDFGSDNIEEYIHAKQSPDVPFAVKKKEIEDRDELSLLKSEVLKLKLNSLRSSNPDLTGDVEAEFVRLIQTGAFSNKTESEILELARVSTGKILKSVDSKVISEVEKLSATASSPQSISASSGGSKNVDINFLSTICSQEEMERYKKHYS